jgi:hypothetical protein
VLAAARQAATAVGLTLRTSPLLAMRRGRYVIAAGLDEDAAGDLHDPSAHLRGDDADFARADGTGNEARTLHGRFVDLFDPALPLLPAVTLGNDTQRLLLDLDALDPREPQLLLAAGRTRPLQRDGDRLRLRIAGIEGRDDHADSAPVLLTMSARPRAVALDGSALAPERIHYQDGLLRLQLPASAAWRTLEITLPR